MKQIALKLPQTATNNKLYQAQIMPLFHANVKVKIPIEYEESIFDEAYAIMEKVDTQYNSYSKGSFFEQINANAGQFTAVDDATIYLLETIKSISEIFDGRYDISIMPLLRLWGFYNGHGQIPTKQIMDKTLELVNFKQIEIVGNSVRIGHSQELMTGSFIKAFSVDRAVDKLRQRGVSDAIINAGHSTIMALNNDAHPFWRVDVKGSDSGLDRLFQVRLRNKCYSTSAQIHNHIEVQKKKYGHIFNARTGFASTNRQTGIISDNCFIGDALSTAFFNVTIEEFPKLMKEVQAIYPVEGFLLDGSGNMVFSDHFLENIQIA